MTRAALCAGRVQHLAAAFPGVYGALMLGMPVSAEGIAMLQELAALLSTANAGKHAGFDPDSGSWSSPAAATAAAPPGIPFGWKDFFAKDQPMLTPSRTMATTPQPVMISCQ